MIKNFNFIKLYTYIWIISIPVSSFLIFPRIQGTTPCYLLTFGLFIYSFLLRKNLSKFYIRFFTIISIFIILNIFSQVSLYFDGVNFGELNLIDKYSESYYLRPTLFTQSLYLIAGIIAFLYTSIYYSDKWDKYIFFSMSLMASYGIYEIFYFMLFHSNGDFISNRLFGDNFIDNKKIDIGFQVINIYNFDILRLKSLTGEPSMYAFTCLPYYFFSIYRKRYFTSMVLLTSLFLTFSTTAVIGLSFLLTYKFMKLKLNNITKSIILILIVSFLFFIYKYSITFEAILNNILLDKLTLTSFSGLERFNIFYKNLEFFIASPILIKLFGIGFGYIRSPDFFSTILVNNGILGLIISLVLFNWPIINNKNKIKFNILFLIIIVNNFLLYFSVSEYAYISIWFFLGISNNIISLKK